MRGGHPFKCLCGEDDGENCSSTHQVKTMRRQDSTVCFAVGERLLQRFYMLKELCGRKQETSSPTEEPLLKTKITSLKPSMSGSCGMLLV